MKKSVLIFVSILILLLGPTVLADLTAIGLSVSDRGVGFSLIQQTASSFFALRIGEFEPYQPRTAPYQVFPALYLNSETKQPLSTIWQKAKGQGWGKTAKAMGLPANYHGKYISAKNKQKNRNIAEMDDRNFEEMMTVRFLHEYYGTDSEFLFYWHSRGLNYEDLFIGVNLGSRTHRDPREFFELRLAGRDWTFIAARYQVPYDQLSKPVTPLKQSVRPSVTSQSDESEPDGPGKGNRNKHK